jgi:DDE superfamily endonuclease
MVGRTSDWKEELGRWLKPFLERLGHKTRRQMCPLYVSGLIGPGDRKSIQPMAERLAFGDYDQLHHFIAAGVWDAMPVETELLVQADRLVGGSDAVLVRRHCDTQERHALRWCRSAICFGAGQDRELPDPGIADAGARRSPGHAGICGCFFPRVGRASGLGWSERVFRPNIERHERNRRWLWRRSIVPSRPVCVLAACWRMPVMG